jgi:hypothetical protein
LPWAASVNHHLTGDNVGFSGWLISLRIAVATVVLCGVAARPARPRFVEAALLLAAAVVLRLAGAATLSLLTDSPCSVTRPLYSDENLFLATSNGYLRNPSGWYDELLLKSSSRFGAVFHAVRLAAPDSGPTGYRVISVLVACSGIIAAWAVARRRYSARASSLVALWGVAWPYALSHDTVFLREPWLTGVLGWMTLGLSTFEKRPVGRWTVAAVATYLGFLMQPHSGMCILCGFVFAEMVPMTARLTRVQRAAFWTAAIVLGAAAVIAVAMKASFGDFQTEMATSYLEQQQASGGSAYAFSPTGGNLGVAIALRYIQYVIGILFVPPTSVVRILAWLDYFCWAPVYIAVIQRIRARRTSTLSTWERWALLTFMLYNLISAGYVVNVGQSIRKRNAFGVLLFPTFGAMLYAREQQRARRRQQLAVSPDGSAPKSAGGADAWQRLTPAPARSRFAKESR